MNLTSITYGAVSGNLSARLLRNSHYKKRTVIILINQRYPIFYEGANDSKHRYVHGPISEGIDLGTVEVMRHVIDWAKLTLIPRKVCPH
jgi:hypothetical protein